MNSESRGRSEPAQPFSAPELRACLDLDDAQLMRQCEIHLHRTGGPGGQHRNKVASAVRLHHRPSGFVVTATERRSQQENRERALTRLREAIAIGIRQPLPEVITWPASVQIRDRRLKVSASNPALCAVLGLVLDAVSTCGGHLSSAAARLDVSASSLTRFLADHPRAWTEANRIRQVHALPPLRA